MSHYLTTFKSQEASYENSDYQLVWKVCLYYPTPLTTQLSKGQWWPELSNLCCPQRGPAPSCWPRPSPGPLHSCMLHARRLDTLGA